MRSIALVLLLVFGFAPLANAGVDTTDDGLKRMDWFAPAENRDFTDLLAQAKAAGKRLVVIWAMPDDADSVKLIEQNYTHPKVAAYAQEHYLVTTMNFVGDKAVTLADGNTATEMDAAMGLDLTLLPTTVFYNDDGSELFRLDGYISPRFYFAGLMYIGTGEYTDDQYRGMFVRWSRANSGRVREIFGDNPNTSTEAPISQ